MQFVSRVPAARLLHLYHQDWLISHASGPRRCALNIQTRLPGGVLRGWRQATRDHGLLSCDCGYGVIESTGPSLCMGLPVSVACCLS